MNKERSRLDSAVLKLLRTEQTAASRLVRLGLVASLGASLVLCQTDAPFAQQRFKEPEVKVTGVSVSGGVVSISADGPLTRAQTFQTPEGFSVVLVNGQDGLGGRVPRGVKVRRVGNSLELVVPVRRGASVTVQPRGSRLDLVVSGGTGDALRVENFETESQAVGAAGESARRQPRERAQDEQAAGAAVSPSARRREAAVQSPQTEAPPPARQPEKKEPFAADVAQAAGGAPKGATPTGEQPVATGAGGDAPPPPASAVAQANAPNVLVAPAQIDVEGGASVGSLLFSLPALLVALGLSLVGAVLFFLRRRRETVEEDLSLPENLKAEKQPEKNGRRRSDVVSDTTVTTTTQPVFEQFKGDRRKSSITVPHDRRRAGQGAEDEATRQQRLEGAAKNGDHAHVMNPSAPAVLFGAYRIEQEISRLVQGQPHSVEVLSSRAADDRRAVETSLLKALRAPDSDEDGRRRARMALEDYGFVARECASLLLGQENFERASAARTLGEMRSGHALPFLTESLYDPDPVVRTEAVQSLGELGLPSAIGALLDVARRHPELPASILGPALTACSVESLEMSWMSASDGRGFGEGFEGEAFTGEIRSLEPAERYEELPEWLEDESLAAALGRLGDADADSRVLSAQHLGQFQVRRAVEALASLAMHDTESSVRAAATTSLGVINHESVFVPVLIALADESREVRAAAARALSRLSFDRADAYVGVMESADAETLGVVARACVHAGLAAQAISRLASEDRRQAYEAFSLLSLVVKAGETEPVLDTIECHRDIEVRLACVRLLNLSQHTGGSQRLLRIADNGGVPEKVRLAILEAVGRAVQEEHEAV